MKSSVQRHKENKNNAISAMVANGLHTVGFLVNNRPEAGLQRKIQSQSHNSLLVAQARAIQNRVNASPQVNQLKAIQAKAADFRTGQGTAVVQRIKDTNGKNLTAKQLWNKYKSTFQSNQITFEEVKIDIDQKGWNDSTVKKYFVELGLEEANSRSNGDDPTYGGARLVGNSGALAKGRYNRSKRKNIVAFALWKKEREAQHLIPACLHRDHPALAGIVDEPENGMMLPATYHKTNKKPTHRRPNRRDHRPYTNNVKTLMGGVKKKFKNKALNQTRLRLIMNVLRAVNKKKGYKYIDDIPYSEFKTEWNTQNSTLML